MDEVIEIEGKKARLSRRNKDGELKVERVVRLEGLLGELIKRAPASWSSNPVLPPGTRWFGKDRNLTLMVMADEPGSKRVAASLEGGEPERLTLAFPYVAYFLLFRQTSFEEMKLYYLREPLVSLDAKLYYSNLLNVQVSRGKTAQNRVCLRPKPPDIQEDEPAMAAVKIISHFWSTDFNPDIEDSCFERSKGLDDRIGTLASWQEAGRRDPLFPLKIDWEPVGLTVREVIAEMFASGPPAPGFPREASQIGDLFFRLEESDYYQYDFDDDSLYPI